MIKGLIGDCNSLNQSTGQVLKEVKPDCCPGSALMGYSLQSKKLVCLNCGPKERTLIPKEYLALDVSKFIDVQIVGSIEQQIAEAKNAFLQRLQQSMAKLKQHIMEWFNNYICTSTIQLTQLLQELRGAKQKLKQTVTIDERKVQVAKVSQTIDQLRMLKIQRKIGSLPEEVFSRITSASLQSLYEYSNKILVQKATSKMGKAIHYYFRNGDCLKSSSIQLCGQTYSWHVSDSYKKLIGERPALFDKIITAIAQYQNKCKGKISPLVQGFTLCISGGKDVSIQSFLGSNAR